jgi:hypothetical protein
MTLKVDTLIPNAPSPEKLCFIPTLPIFDGASCAFVEAFSRRLMQLPEARMFPELPALAFWFRKGALENLRGQHEQRRGNALLVPRGTVLHFAPANVDTIFVYSWFLSLLTGNRNIVRVSSKGSPQASLLIDLLVDLLADSAHEEILRRTVLLQCDAAEEINVWLSAMCDVRVIWGSDETVQQIRRSPLPPASIEVAFVTKYSLAVVQAQRLLEASEKQKDSWAQAFYNDAYGFDQMACSSPRLVLWLGTPEQAAAAAADFWPRVERELVSRHRRFDDLDYVNKLVAIDSLAIDSSVRYHAGISNDLTRLWLNEPKLHSHHHCGAGLFFESAIADLEAIRPLLDRTVQTVSYAGFQTEELRQFVLSGPLCGIDRIVPFGHALDFSPVWDGFDMLRTFTREIALVWHSPMQI